MRRKREITANRGGVNKTHSNGVGAPKRGCQPKEKTGSKESTLMTIAVNGGQKRVKRVPFKANNNLEKNGGTADEGTCKLIRLEAKG